MPKSSPITQIFFSQGISRSVLYWLVFRQSLNTNGWAEAARSCTRKIAAEEVEVHAAASDDQNLLMHWLHKQPTSPVAEMGGAWAATSVGAFLGALAMFGACNYSGAAPVNLWLLLALFAFLPLILTVFAYIGWRMALSRSAGTPPLVASILFRPVLKRLASVSQDSAGIQVRTLRPWLLWKLQWLAVAFQVAALLVFYLTVLFQDVAFGWSSTVVADGSWMTTALQAIAWPWHWLLDMPSHELIAGSHFYRGAAGFDAKLLGQWWSYIAMAMIFYGLLPRLLLALWMRYRVKQLLQNEMYSSGDIERFLKVIRMPTDASQAVEDATLETLAVSTYVNSGRADPHYVAWQYSPSCIAVDTTLGTSRWSEDETWIEQNSPNWERPVVFLVMPSQTPTEELADIIQLLRRCNSTVQVELQLIVDNSPPNTSIYAGQVKSWQLFARKHQLAISVLQQEAEQ